MVNDLRYEAFRRTRSDARIALDLARQNRELTITLRATQLEHGRAIAGLAPDLAEIRKELAEVLRRLPS